ncbi:PepSY domain-containing protein [Nonomuraea sp. NEAU-A123]|uniref:PepSY domain-containing protein n=1 Tax=Nonomuraea sp. NEAU-A123 TaxID=2839649 RepID=UPI001BE400AF|nr:PepSY domain-containing protein [Nonomuraea sp. NEAU-A123]MBT2227585.1 PepSY domain-containing protein [Nonomuraea sp. NEAU-A123]
MNKTIIGGGLVGAALLAAAACGADARQMSGQGADTPTPYVAATASPLDPEAGSQQRSGMKKLEEVGQAALKAVPGSTLVSMESEENGSLWEVRVVDAKGTEHQMDIKSDPAKVVSGPSAQDDDSDDQAEYLGQIKATKLDYQQAADKIAKAVPGGRITELNLDSHRDKIVWEVDVVTSDGNKQNMMVDATDGTVTKDSERD